MNIKFDKITGEIRENDATKFDTPILAVDDFSVPNNDWEKMGAYTATTKTIANGVLTVASPSNYNVGAFRNRKSCGKNTMISVDAVGSAIQTGLSSTHRIHHRESQNYFGYCAITKDTGAIQVSKLINNTATAISASFPIVGYAKEKTYRMISKCYENFISLIVLENGKSMASAGGCHSDILALTSTNNGLCGAGISIYDNYKSQPLNGMINIICLGDSLTFGYQLNQEDNCSNILNTMFTESPMFFNNKGVVGNTISQVTARLATDLTANKVNKAKNICLLLIGTNDIAVGTTAADCFTAWNTLVDGIMSAGFEVWACTVTPRNTETTNNTTIRAFNYLIKQSTKPKVIIDLYSAMVNPTDDNNAITGYMQADGRHFTAIANNVWANLVKTEILNIYPSINTGLMNCDKAFVRQIESKSEHPTNYKPIFQDTDTKELYIYTGE